ncbi:Dynein heavy chain 10, axonemal [Irineochytrium annulatum]|nr:Dynein heavy chain 10, axonemal [Irineochytrium annulatum]
MVSTSDLLAVRLGSKKMKALSDLTLSARLDLLILNLADRHDLAEDQYRDAEKEKRPHLRHYRNFLRNITTNEITEATWYATPPEELKTVCECLCILKGSPLTIKKQTSAPTLAVSSPSFLSVDTDVTTGISADASFDAQTEEPMSWATIKKVMTRYDFKTWLTNLRVGVDYVPFQHVKRVEKIIMMDPNVTYERLREVSMAGYKLLIIVAACLQYCSISEDLRLKRKDMVMLDKQLGRYKVFVAAVNGTSTSSPRV